MLVIDRIITSDRNDVYKFGVYKLFHLKKPEIIYVGSAASSGRIGDSVFHKRFCGHLNLLRKNKHASRYLQNIVNKYGIDGIRMEILELTEAKDAFIREEYFINRLKPKLNTCLLPTKGWLGVKHKHSSKYKMRLAKLGRKLTPEHSQNISNATRGKKKRYNYEACHSASAREKRAQKMRGRIQTMEERQKRFKAAYQFTLVGALIKKHNSIMAASKETSIDRASINHCCLGNRESCGGFAWSFIPEWRPTKRIIVQKTLDGTELERFSSLAEIQRKFNLPSTTAIRNCFSGKQKKAYGFIWQELFNKNAA